MKVPTHVYRRLYIPNTLKNRLHLKKYNRNKNLDSVALLPFSSRRRGGSDILGSGQTVDIVEGQAGEGETRGHTHTMHHTTRKHRQQQARHYLWEQFRLEVPTEIHVLEVVDGREGEDEDLRSQESSEDGH